MEELSVDDLPIRNADDILLLLKQIELITDKHKLSIKWNRLLNEIDGPQVVENQKRFVIYLKEKCSLIEDASDWNIKSNYEYKDLLDIVGKTGDPQFNDTQWFIELLNGLQVLKYQKIRSETQELFETVQSYLSKGRDHSLSHPIWNDIFNALKQRDKTMEKLFCGVDWFRRIRRGLQTVYRF